MQIRFYFFVFLCLNLSSTWAQSALKGSVRGTVVTVDGQPAAFVNIILTEINRGAITDSQGDYEIKRVVPGDYHLVASLIGLQNKEVTIQVSANGTTTVPSIVLTENASQLSEVIVRSNRGGYETQIPSPSLRVQTPLLELPQSVIVVNSQLIQDQQILNLGEKIDRNVSGIYQNGNGSYSNLYPDFAIRGFRTNGSGLINGMQLQSNFATSGGLVDASVTDRIEFVKGAAGFMIGNTDAGGFYNVVTKKPTGETATRVNATFGSYNLYRIAADVQGAVTADRKLLFRFNTAAQTSNTIRDFDYFNKYTVAPVLQYRLGERTTATLEYIFSSSNFLSMRRSSYGVTSFADADYSFSLAEPNMRPSSLTQHTVFANLTHAISDQWKVTAQFGFDAERGKSNFFEDNSLIAPGVLKRDFVIWDSRSQFKVGQLFLSGETKTGAVAHRVLAGLDGGTQNAGEIYYYLKSGYPIAIHNPVHDVPFDSLPDVLPYRNDFLKYANYINTYSYQSVYAQDEVGIGPLRITLAGRYTQTRKSNAGKVETNTAWTPRVGLSYSLDSRTSLYALYDNTFREQLGSSFDNKQFDPSYGRNYEVGFKRNWMGDLLSTNIALFKIVKTNVLTTDPLHQGFSIETGEVTAKGIELDILGQLTPNLNVVANAAFIDSQITKDTDPKNVGQKTPITAGQTYNAWVTYRLLSGPLQGVGFSLGGQHQADRYTYDSSSDPTPNYKLPDQTQVDAGVNFRKNLVTVGLLINNLLNAKLYTGYKADGYYQTFYSDPINFRLNMSYKF